MRGTLNKRWWIWLGAALLLVAGSIALDAGVVAGCGGCGGGGPDEKGAKAAPCRGAGGGSGCCGAGRGPGKGAGKGRGAGMAHHENIHGLLDRHAGIERKVKEIKGGVVTITTSDDPETAKMIREHVRQMKQRVESGHGMRWWDPLFAEIFEHHDKIVMEIEDVPGGVKVRETSDDPQVAALIRQHAVRGVNEFVAEGRARACQPTPLPEGYASGGTP
jgi:hypothetical protein